MDKFWSFKKYIFWILFGFIGIHSTLFSQEFKLDSIYYLSDFDIIDRIIISDSEVTSQTLQTYDVKTPYWKDSESIKISKQSVLKDKVYLIVENGRSGKGGAVLTLKENGFIFFHRWKETVNSIDILKSYNYSILPLKLYFNQTFKDQYYSLKSMDEVSKKDLILAINYAQGQEDTIKDYLKTNTLRQFHGFRISENLFNYKLFSLGYDPYKLPETGNYIDKHKNDADLKALFEGDKIFKLRID